MSKADILVVDDEPAIRGLVQEILEDEGYAVRLAESAEAARVLLQQGTPDLLLLDIWMPGEDGISLLKDLASSGLTYPVVMISGHGTVETAVEATRLGAVDFVEKPLSMGKLLATVDQALVSAPRSPEGAEPPAMLEPVGKSKALQALREQAAKVAGTQSRVLLSGPPGSGCRLFARYIHGLSAWAQGPFLEFSGATADADLAAERLFGVEENTGRRPGLLELAAGGTLVIDRVSELSLEIQDQLAAALRSGGFHRVGGHHGVPLEARLSLIIREEIAPAVQEGRLREDLCYHLNVVLLHVPSLRDHSEDVPELLAFFVDQLVDREQLPFRRFTVAAQNRLRHHDWPGHVRELGNLVRRLLVMGEGLEIDVGEVEQAMLMDQSRLDQSSDWTPARVLDMPLREAREQFERVYLERQLQRAGGSVAQLARLAGMERTHLYRKLRSLGIDQQKPEDAGE